MVCIVPQFQCKMVSSNPCRSMKMQMTLVVEVSLTVSRLAMQEAEWGAAPLALLEETNHSTMQLCIIDQCSVSKYVVDTFVTLKYNEQSQQECIRTYIRTYIYIRTGERELLHWLLHAEQAFTLY